VKFKNLFAFILILIPLTYGFVGVGFMGGSSPQDWRKCELSINASKVSSDLTSFPVLLTEDNLPSECLDKDGSYHADDGGGNIQFWDTKDGNTRYPCEVVNFVTDNDPANGKAEIWVKLPSVNGTVDTDFWIWYGKPGVSQPDADSIYGSEKVWDSSFQLVYHMDDDPSGSPPQILDSTSNDNNGNSIGSMTSGDIVDAAVGKGTDFDGSDDCFDIANLCSDIASGNFTISMWFEPTATFDSSTATTDMLFRLGDSPSSNDIDIYLEGDTNSDNRVANGALGFGVVNGSSAWVSTETPTTSWTGGVAHYIVASFGSSAGMDLRVDGSSEDTDPNTTRGSTVANECYLASHWYHLTTWTFRGIIDELRVSNVRRSSSWLDSTYYNQSDPGSFVTAGTPE